MSEILYVPDLRLNHCYTFDGAPIGHWDIRVWKAKEVHDLISLQRV